MPKWLRRYLRSRTLRAHLKIALISGLFVRLCSAFFVYGPQALDDYKHGVWPAYQYFAGQMMDLPSYRSHLLVWCLAGFIKVGSWFGAESALAQVRVMYTGLAVVSLCGILGTYYFVRGLRGRIFPALALYLVALFPIMPFVSTRAFGEAVALSFVAFGLGVLEDARRATSPKWGQWILGFAILGVAVLFRFHVGLIFVSYALILVALQSRPAVLGAAIGGVLTLAAQAAIDVASGKPALGTLFIYLSENEGGGAKYGVSPWYNPWLLVMALAFLPFSFALFKHVRALWRRHWPVVVPFLVFVAAHSAAAHKEERFLFPVFGIELWFVAFLWAASTFDRWSKKIFVPAIFSLGAVLLFIFCFVNTQEGEIEPPAYVQKNYGNVIYLDYESLFGMSWFKFYFLRPPSVVEKVGREDFNAPRIDQALADNASTRAVVLLTSVPAAEDELRALAGIKTLSAQCLTMRTAGSLIDRLLYFMNAKHNQRRRPTWYLVCERSES